jgi:hypothetical protein
MWAVDRTARPVHVERLVRLHRTMHLQPTDRIVREILTQVITLLRRLRWKHDRRVAHQVRFVLRRLTGKEAVEVVKSQPGRPVVERPRRGGRVGRGVVPLAERCGRIPVVVQHLRLQRAAARDPTGVAVPVVRQLGDLAVADSVVVATRQQRRSRRRAHRSRVEPVVSNALIEEPLQRWRMDLTTEGVGQRRTRIVDQHDQHVRCVRWQVSLRRIRLIHRLLHRPPGRAARLALPERQLRTIDMN